MTPHSPVEAHILRAIDALKRGQGRRAFLFSALACSALPTRNDLRQLLAASARLAGHTRLAARITPALPPHVPQPIFCPPRHRGPAPDKVVDVLVPVHGGPVQTMECIHSVLRYTKSNKTRHRVTVLDDASPHAQLSQDLLALARSGVIDYVRRPENLGFIRNMNRGMAMHPWRDVVWLNSDTRVHGNWLDRLRAAATHMPRIAAVTPLSNFGELMGFPFPRRRNAMPGEQEQAEVDDLARQLALAPPAVETCCGFCMYLRRKAIDDIGYLDESALARGYGEDTDWSMRAKAAGWSVACAVDMFIAHEGTVSFSDEKIARVNQNNAVLRERYPGLDARYQAAAVDDPMRPARTALQRARLPVMAAQLRQQGQARLFIVRQQPDPPAVSLQFFKRGEVDWVALHVRAKALPLELEYRLPRDFRRLLKDLRLLPIERLVFGPLRDCPHAVLRLPELLGLPYAISCKDDALLDDADQARAFAAGAVEVKLPWRALGPRYRRALPKLVLSFAAKQATPLPPAPPAGSPAALLVADDLQLNPHLLDRWVAYARACAQEMEPPMLLMERLVTVHKDLLATGVVSRLPRVEPLNTREILQLAGCNAALSLETDPGAGWLAPDAAARHGLPLFAPVSEVALEAGALPLAASGDI